jgi:hypothetical protein
LTAATLRNSFGSRRRIEKDSHDTTTTMPQGSQGGFDQSTRVLKP